MALSHIEMGEFPSRQSFGLDVLRPGPDLSQAFYAMAARTARVGKGVRIGWWTCIGPGAQVGFGSCLGHWSSIGPFSRVGAFVHFGAGSRVGMDSIVDPFCVLDDHEYVPSGFRRYRDGSIRMRMNLPEGQDRFRSFYDRLVVAGGSWSALVDRGRAPEPAGTVIEAFRDMVPWELKRRRSDILDGWLGGIRGFLKRERLEAMDELVHMAAGDEYGRWRR